MSHRTALLSGLPLAVLLGSALLGQFAIATEPATAVVAKLDKDSDEILDAKEVRGVIGEATFKAADPDNDGTLSKTEYPELGSKAGRTLKQRID